MTTITNHLTFEQAWARHLAEHGPWLRAVEARAAAEHAAYEADLRPLIDAGVAVIGLTGIEEPLTDAQELAVLTRQHVHPDLTTIEQLIDAALGAEELPEELIHPRWRHAA